MSPCLRGEVAPAAPRLASLDVLRGLTVGVMLFVNDLAGVKGVPAWMKHVHPNLQTYPALERRALALNDLNSAEAKAGLVERPGGVD